MIRQLPLEEEADVVVLGDTAYDANSARSAGDERSYNWIIPANPRSRVGSDRRSRSR